MKKNILNKLLLIITCLAFLSCKAKKPLTTTSTEGLGQVKTAHPIGLELIIATQATFKTFTTKAATQLAINGKNYDVTLNIRIKSGEAIWVSITAIAGVEVARALITPDSVKIMDRINDEYLKKSFSFIHDFTNSQIDYQTLEALLVGNCVPFMLNKEVELVTKDEILNLNGSRENLKFQLKFNDQLKATQTFINDISAGQSLIVNRPTFEEIAGQLFPTQVLIDSKSVKKQIKANMEYSKTMLNIDLDYPFNVPKRFSVND